MVYALMRAVGAPKVSLKSLAFTLSEALSPPYELKPDDPRLQWDGLALQVTAAGLRNMLWQPQGLDIAQRGSVPLGLQFVFGLMEMVRIQSDDLKARQVDTEARHHALHPRKKVVEVAVLQLVPWCTTDQAAALGTQYRQRVCPQQWTRQQLVVMGQGLVPKAVEGVDKAHLDALRATMMCALLMALPQHVAAAAQACLRQWSDPQEADQPSGSGGATSGAPTVT